MYVEKVKNCKDIFWDRKLCIAQFFNFPTNTESNFKSQRPEIGSVQSMPAAREVEVVLQNFCVEEDKTTSCRTSHCHLPDNYGFKRESCIYFM